MTRDRFQKRLEALRTERDPHISNWQEITDYIRPTRGRYLYKSSEESKKPTKLINNTPTMASQVLQAGLMSGVSSPAYAWFKLTYADPGLNTWGPGKVYIEARQRILYDIFARSNFYNQAQTAYGDAGDFGNMLMIMDADFNDVISCTIPSPGEYFIALGANGDVNTVYREYTRSVSQLVEEFGRKVSDSVWSLYSQGNYETRIKVITAIEMNFAQDPSGFGWMRAPFIAVTYEWGSPDTPDKDFLEVRPYYSWPIPNLRWNLGSGNVYGSGPGLTAYGDARALQTLERRKAQAIDKLVTPPLQGPSGLQNRPISHSPGGMTYVDMYTAGAGRPVQPLYEVSPHGITAISNEIKEHEHRIDVAYYRDLFLLLSYSDRREVTATEINAKHEEKLIALGPMLQRTHRDFLDNAVARADFLADEAGLYPPPPADLEGKTIRTRYISTLAYAQRAVSVGGIERMIGFTGNVGAINPDIWHKIDLDETVDEYADGVGAPARMIVPTRKAQAARAAAKAAEGAPAMAEAAETTTNAAKLASETDTTRPSLLNQILKGTGLA